MKGLNLRKKEIKEPPLRHIKLYLHFYVAYLVDIFLSFPTFYVRFYISIIFCNLNSNCSNILDL